MWGGWGGGGGCHCFYGNGIFIQIGMCEFHTAIYCSCFLRLLRLLSHTLTPSVHSPFLSSAQANPSSPLCSSCSGSFALVIRNTGWVLSWPNPVPCLFTDWWRKHRMLTLLSLHKPLLQSKALHRVMAEWQNKSRTKINNNDNKKWKSGEAEGDLLGLCKRHKSSPCLCLRLRKRDVRFPRLEFLFH